MNVLIIDDDRDDRDIFCEALKEMYPSANCIIYESAEAALQFLRESNSKPDYIFLDALLGGMDGKQCLFEIKMIESIKGVPIIIYSGLDDTQGEVYKKPGAAKFVTKPSSINELRRLLTSIISH